MDDKVKQLSELAIRLMIGIITKEELTEHDKLLEELAKEDWYYRSIWRLRQEYREIERLKEAS